MEISQRSSSALVIVIQTSSGARFFAKFGKGRSVQTDWHIAGAKLFMSEALSDDVRDICKELTAKGKKFEVHPVAPSFSNPLSLSEALFCESN